LQFAKIKMYRNKTACEFSKKQAKTDIEKEKEKWQKKEPWRYKPHDSPCKRLRFPGKPGMALRTGDVDPALAFGYTEGLLAARAPIEVMCFALGNAVLYIQEKGFRLSLCAPEKGQLLPAPGEVS
jgi:hypothetical protein